MPSYSKKLQIDNSMESRPLPHFRPRTAGIDTIVLHCSAHDTEGMIRVLEEHKLSTHYVIGYDGTITQLVNDREAAFHAGVSFWRGKNSLNDCSIGIETSNESLGQTPYDRRQIDSLTALLRRLTKKYNIRPENIVGHSDVAPSRKPDPGISFPWKLLSDNGFGLWYYIDDAQNMPEKNVAKLLRLIGYDTHSEESILASCYAFRRHFLPEEVAVDNDIYHLVDNVYPVGDTRLKEGEKFLKTLKAVAYRYDSLSNTPCNI